MNVLSSAKAAVQRALGAPLQTPPPSPQAPLRCSQHHMPKGALYDPMRWHPRLPVLLQQFSAHLLWLGCPEPKRQPPLHAKLTLILSCFELGRCKVRVQVVQPRADADASLVVRMLQPSRRALRILGQYALLYGDAEDASLTPLALRGRQFGAIDVTPCMHFEALTDASQMAEVKALRYRVFKESALLKPEQQRPNDTEDERDARSYIILGKFRHKLVASCRAYAMALDDAYEFDAWCQDTDALPPKDQCVELGRAAIDVPFRGASIPLTLMRMLTAYTMQSGRRYMVLGTTPALVPFYQSFGFEVTPIRFPYPGRSDFLAHVLVADLHQLWRGERGNPLIWYTLFGSLSESCAKGFYAPHNRREMVRLGVLRSMGPVSRSVHQWLGLQRRLRRRVRN